MSVFNHVGLCVHDIDRSRRFYEELLGFTFWWAFEAPDELTAPVLRLEPPVGLQAVYLVRDGFVLELLRYDHARHLPVRERTMNEPGLTHISLAVDDLPGTLARVPEYGGTVLHDTANDAVAFVRDPDGQLVELGTMAWRDQLPPLP